MAHHKTYEAQITLTGCWYEGVFLDSSSSTLFTPQYVVSTRSGRLCVLHILTP